MTMSDNGKSAETARIGAARKASLPKRFYKKVALKDEDGGGASLLLDGKAVRTPGKALLLLRTRALAEAIAAEWRGQGERIDPSTMPLTRLANSAIDGVKGREAGRHRRYHQLCRLGPHLLSGRGAQGAGEGAEPNWDKVARLRARTARCAARPCRRRGACRAAAKLRSPRSGKRSRASMHSSSRPACHDCAHRLGAARDCRAARRRLAEEAWEAAHVDEDWQISQWGEDEEAKERRANRWRDFAAAAAHARNLAKLTGTNGARSAIIGRAW